MVEGTVSADQDGLARLVHILGADAYGCVEMMSGAVWVREQLQACGWRFAVADARKVKAIVPLACKTDRVDARVLAQLAARDLVPELWIPSLADRELRERLRRREHLVRLRTSARNRMFGLLTQWGLRGTLTTLRKPDALPRLAERGVPPVWIESVQTLLEVVDDLDRQISEIERELRPIARADPRAQLLATIPGLGPLLALTITADIGDISRFPNARKLVGYAGLAPTIKQSGQSSWIGPISKAGHRRCAGPRSKPPSTRGGPATPGTGSICRPRRGTARPTRPRAPDAGIAAARAEFAAAALQIGEAGEWQSFEIGPFTVTALPAADGTGESQVSWAVAAGGQRILHCGDTMFHGWRWRLAHTAGPFDAAFLPINGAVVNFPWRQPASPYSAVMTAEDAVIAGRLLGAGVTVPTHFGGFDLEPFYRSASDALDRFVSAADGQQLAVRPFEVGEAVEVDAVSAGRDQHQPRRPRRLLRRPFRTPLRTDHPAIRRRPVSISGPAPAMSPDRNSLDRRAHRHRR